MLIELENIFNIEGSEIVFNSELDLSGYEIGLCKPFTEPAKVTGKVFNTTGIVKIQARATAKMQTICDRCAGDFTQKMDVPVDHILVTSLNDESNDDFILLEKPQLDLDQLVTEDIFLALPTKILCKNDCKGICQKCGKNLNHGQCSCEKATDSRLEALKQLLDNQ
jgi:uncharacterized protein